MLLPDLELIENTVKKNKEILILFYKEIINFAKNDKLLQHQIITTSYIYRSKQQDEIAAKDFFDFQYIYWNGVVKPIIDMGAKNTFQKVAETLYSRFWIKCAPELDNKLGEKLLLSPQGCSFEGSYYRQVDNVYIPTELNNLIQESRTWEVFGKQLSHAEVESLKDFLQKRYLYNQREVLAFMIEAYIIYNRNKELLDILHHEQDDHSSDNKPIFLNFKYALEKCYVEPFLSRDDESKEFKFIYFLLFYFILEFLKKDKGKIQEEAKKTWGVLQQYDYLIPTKYEKKLSDIFKNHRSFLESANIYKEQEPGELENLIQKFADALEVAAMDQTDN